LFSLGVTEPNWFLTNAAFLCGFFFGQEPKKRDNGSRQNPLNVIHYCYQISLL